MAERKLDFAHSNWEVVHWLLSNTRTTGFFPISESVVHGHIERMKAAGWDEEKMLEKCARFDLYGPGYLQVELHHIVYFQHPVLQDVDDQKVRLALYKAAAIEIGRTRANEFKETVHPRLGLPKEHYRGRVSALEEFMRRLAMEATPAVGIRNK